MKNKLNAIKQTSEKLVPWTKIAYNKFQKPDKRVPETTENRPWNLREREVAPPGDERTEDKRPTDEIQEPSTDRPSVSNHAQTSLVIENKIRVEFFYL